MLKAVRRIVCGLDALCVHVKNIEETGSVCLWAR